MSDLTELVVAAADGSSAARDELVDAILPRVRAMVHGALQRDFRNSHPWILPLFSTQDVVQDVLHDAVKSLGQGEFSSDAAVLRYLSTVVHNRLLAAIRHYQAGKRDVRRSGPAEEHEVDAAETSPQGAAELAERARITREVMDALPERERTLIELRIVEDQKFRVIAERLGYSSQETARQAYWRVQARIAVELRRRGIRAGGAE